MAAKVANRLACLLSKLAAPNPYSYILYSQTGPNIPSMGLAMAYKYTPVPREFLIPEIPATVAPTFETKHRERKGSAAAKGAKSKAGICIVCSVVWSIFVKNYGVEEINLELIAIFRGLSNINWQTKAIPWRSASRNHHDKHFETTIGSILYKQTNNQRSNRTHTMWITHMFDCRFRYVAENNKKHIFFLLKSRRNMSNRRNL